jgi:hypothetical protein
MKLEKRFFTSAPLKTLLSLSLLIPTSVNAGFNEMARTPPMVSNFIR